jgi:hypothetical protein
LVGFHASVHILGRSRCLRVSTGLSDRPGRHNGERLGAFVDRQQHGRAPLPELQLQPWTRWMPLIDPSQEPTPVGVEKLPDEDSMQELLVTTSDNAPPSRASITLNLSRAPPIRFILSGWPPLLNCG